MEKSSFYSDLNNVCSKFWEKCLKHRVILLIIGENHDFYLEKNNMEKNAIIPIALLCYFRIQWYNSF